MKTILPEPFNAPFLAKMAAIAAVPFEENATDPGGQRRKPLVGKNGIFGTLDVNLENIDWARSDRVEDIHRFDFNTSRTA